MTFTTRNVLQSLIASALVLPTAVGQENVDPTAPAQEADSTSATTQAEPAAVDALANLTKGEFHFDGTVSIDRPDNGMQGMIMVGGMGSTGEPFAGDLMIVGTEGRRLVASHDAFPGFAVYRSGETIVSRATSVQEKGETKSFDANGVRDDLSMLLDTERVLAWARTESVWSKTAGEQEGEFTYQTKIPGDVAVPPAPDPFGGMGGMGGMIMDPMAESIMHVTLSLTTGANGTVHRFALDVVRSDPMAAIETLAMENGGELDMEMMAELEPVEGAVRHYSFKRGASGTNKRAAAILAEFKDLQK